MTEEIKKTVVIGASPNQSRYSNMAVRLLHKYGHQVFPVGIRKGEILDLEIIIGKPNIDNVDTITLYLGAPRQANYYNYILSLAPKRLIFNPGAENAELFKLAAENKIEVLESCTLVMLNTGVY